MQTPTPPTRTQSRKRRGRLDHQTMRTLGQVLGDYFEHVRKQQVPDRITDLVKQFEERNGKGQS